MKKMW